MGTMLLNFVVLFTVKLVLGELWVVNLDSHLSLECTGGGTGLVAAGMNGSLDGSGRCYYQPLNRYTSLIEYTVLPEKIYVDISLVDACDFFAKIESGGRIVSLVDCGCSHDSITLSPCSLTGMPEVCCTKYFSSPTACLPDNEYLRWLSSCSTGVYGYPYDDVKGLKVFNTSDDVIVTVVSEGSVPRESTHPAEGPNGVIFNSANVLWRVYYILVTIMSCLLTLV